MGRRIIFTVTNDLAFDQRMQRICGSLAAAGYAVTLVGRLKNDSRSLTNQPYQQVRLKHMLFSKGKLFYLEFNIRLLFYLLFVRTDAICSIDLDTALPGILVAKLRKKVSYFRRPRIVYPCAGGGATQTRASGMVLGSAIHLQAH